MSEDIREAVLLPYLEYRNTFAQISATLIIRNQIISSHKMSASDFLQLLYVIISLLEKVFQYKIVASKIVSLIWGGVKRVTGGLIVFLGISWMGMLPVSMWASARTIPVVNPYSWAFGLGMMILFGFVLEMVGLLVVGYGSMYFAPNSRFGRHFRYRVFVRRNKRLSGTPQRMGYITIISKLIGQLLFRLTVILS